MFAKDSRHVYYQFEGQTILLLFEKHETTLIEPYDIVDKCLRAICNFSESFKQQFRSSDAKVH